MCVYEIHAKIARQIKITLTVTGLLTHQVVSSYEYIRSTADHNSPLKMRNRFSHFTLVQVYSQQELELCLILTCVL